MLLLHSTRSSNMMEPEFSSSKNRFNQLFLLVTDLQPKSAGQKQQEDPFTKIQTLKPSEDDKTRRVVPASIISQKKSLVSISNSLASSKNDSFSSSPHATNNEKEPTKPEPSSGTKVNDDGTIRVPSGSGFRIMVPFPWRLHEILGEVEEKQLDWIVSWLPDGKSFQVHCQKSFSEIIIPMFFRHSRYKSFQRQLYLYGFRSLDTQNMSRGAYFHPKFIREDRSLCKDIVRVKTETVNSKRDNTKIRKRKQSSASSHGSQQRQRQQTQEQYDTALPPPIHLQQNPPMAITSSLSSSISPPSNHTQGYSFHQSVPPNKFSQNLLIHSEDIISLFGDGF